MIFDIFFLKKRQRTRCNLFVSYQYSPLQISCYFEFKITREISHDSVQDWFAQRENDGRIRENSLATVCEILEW